MNKSTSYIKKSKVLKNIFIISMLALPILHFLIFFVYINIDTILLSFQRFNYNTGSYQWVGMDNFSRLYRDFIELDSIKTALINSLLLFPVTNFITLPLSIISAYFLYRKVPGNKIFRVIFFLPSILSIVVLTMSFQFMLDPYFGPGSQVLRFFGLDPVGGWFGNKGTVMPMIFIYLIWAGIGFNVVLLNGAISRIPQEIIESARLDGIGMFKELVLIVIPLVWPTITTLFIVGTTSVFTLFLQNMLLANGGPSGASMTIAYMVVEMVQNGNLTDAAALGTAFTLIGVPIIFLIKRFMEKFGENVEY